MALDRKEPARSGSAARSRSGLTKEGETFAAGSAGERRSPQVHRDRRRGHHDLTYQGRTFPICCTGCRDEFNDNPEKYLKKAALMAQSPASEIQAGRPAALASAGWRTPLPAMSSTAPAMKENPRRPARPTKASAKANHRCR